MIGSLEVLDFFGIPQFGGSLTLLCEWRIGPDLEQHMKGDPVSLATHVHDANGTLLVFDGPRSLPVLPDGQTHRIAVPLVVPAASGIYHISVDAVVEGKFWASWLGNVPVRFQIERLPDGALAGALAGQPYQFYVAAHRRFRIPHPLYGLSTSERAVEIPWILSRYRGECRVLDIGYAHAEAQYLTSLAFLDIPVVIGLDMAVGTGPDLRLVADVRHPALRPSSIDLILAISVIEHIGRDNQQYFQHAFAEPDDSADFATVRSLAALLKPGGRLLLTVPFGIKEDHGWFIQYDAARLHALVSASGLTLAEVEFYQYHDGWHGPVSPHILTESCYRVEDHSASAVACVVLHMPLNEQSADAVDVVRDSERVIEGKDHELLSCTAHARSLETALMDKDGELHAGAVYARSLEAALARKDHELQSAAAYARSLEEELVRKNQ